ncbi:hypothetical protein Pcinc_001567 [Petrolisthes cinctipes]|uniref:Secreted protein n=1 Tax=Petrolisthes cinctipes TaxID=88211 RepID=A0AAE1FC03_PETCI|nr:hypothetical protein Pcinc_023604 [Petrolisthes cinctipes]KAK3894683.1 hypothetical protein Pcinc_001567 [Petrolisthes cinctipes]
MYSLWVDLAALCGFIDCLSAVLIVRECGCPDVCCDNCFRCDACMDDGGTLLDKASAWSSLLKKLRKLSNTTNLVFLSKSLA